MILRGQRYADERKTHHLSLTVPRCSVRLMSCGGESFSSGCACGSAWDSVMPMKGKYTINYIQYP